MSLRDVKGAEDIPEIMYDTINKQSYKRQRFFGKGGFAKCYEIVDCQTKEVWAGKIVSKKLMMKGNQREKMTQEISIHKSLKHKHVVAFHGFFEDHLNIYIILELCKKRSMMELHKRRKAITEPETRFYMHQILLGVQYLHSQKIIHRDLKLGNIFLNDNLQIKLGDFGLAAKIEFEGERKKTLCGTPNYIAPEILNKRGHSFEVDIWSTGCIMYTLLIGKPPFETSSLKETYTRIKKCDYRLPSTLHKFSAAMIIDMLQADPVMRPPVDKLLKHDFFEVGYMPKQLPSSCLTMEPRFDQVENTFVERKPLHEVNRGNETTMAVDSPKKLSIIDPAVPSFSRFNIFKCIEEQKQNIINLRDQLHQLLKTKPGREHGNFGDEMSDPAAQPLVWISKWVDYSDKYGFGYQLCDEGVGVMFNDTTKIIMLANAVNVHYIAKDGAESYMTMDNYPPNLEKKMKLLTYFRRYMTEHLMKAGALVPVRECDSLSRMPHLHQWFRTNSGVIMHLTNGSVQINFLDHTKIIMCPLMAAVTYIDPDKNFRTFRFSSIEKHGCSMGLYNNLRYALEKINNNLLRPIQ